MDKQLDAGGDLDLLVLRQLSALPALGPSRGFADRVMAGVVRPRPRSLATLQRAGAWVAQPARVYTLAAAYALSVAIALRLAIPWLADHGSAFSLAATWLASRAGSLADAAAVAVGSWAVESGTTDALRSALSAGPVLWAALAVLTVGYAVCGYGMRVLLRAPNRGRSDAALGTL